MSITNNNAVAKIAAFVAGAGLVAMSFAPLAKADTTTDLQNQINTLLAEIASLQGQLGGSTTATATFTRDLTIGSTGADVTALQTWLISKGYAIPAGATGYFGTQTQAAVAAFQAANGITPAAGYFGPITRAKVNAMAGTSTGTGTGGTTTGGTTLNGGEADLSNFDLQSGDDLNEGDSNVEIASAKFDVDGGDVSVQRVKVTLQADDTTSGFSEDPWKFFDKLAVYDGNTKVGSVDVGSKSDWDDEDGDSDLSDADDAYTIDIPVTGEVVKEGDTAELSIRADAQSTIDSDDIDQTFHLTIGKDSDTDGIRAVDAAGIQQYIGGNDDVEVGFNPQENGDLTVSEASDDPDAGILVADEDKSSDEYEVFDFNIKNSDDSDATLNEVTLGVDLANTGGADLKDIVRKATLEVGGDSFDADMDNTNVGSYEGTLNFDNLDVSLDANKTTEFTLKIELASQGDNEENYDNGSTLQFTLAHGDVDAEGTDSGDSSDVSGTAVSNVQTVQTTGITVTGTDTSAEVNDPTDPDDTEGTYRIMFDVTAGDDDIYIPTGAATSSTASTTGVVYTPNGANTFVGAAQVALTSQSHADTVSGYYLVRAGDTESFTLTVVLNPVAPGGIYEVDMTGVKFNTDVSSPADDTLLDVSDNDDFQSDTLNIPS